MLDLLYIYIYTRVKSEFSFFAPPSPSFYPFPIRSPRIMLQFSFHEHEIIHDQGSLESTRRQIDDLEYYGDWPA